MKSLRNIIREQTERFIMMEKRNIQSQRLYYMIKYFGKPLMSDVDLHSLTDDEIVDVCDIKDVPKGKGLGIIKFNNGQCIVVDKTQNNTSHDNKWEERWRERRKTDGKDEYRWNNKDAEDMVFKNPYFKEWPKNYQRKAIDNIKQGKRIFDNKENW